MQQIHPGQCGMCLHYGEHHTPEPELIQIRMSKVAPEDLIEECGHPRHAALNLMVTPISGCDGFEAAPETEVH